jgi:hypothetical protein
MGALWATDTYGRGILLREASSNWCRGEEPFCVCVCARVRACARARACVCVCVEKLVVLRLAKKFLYCYGTWQLIVVFKRDSHLCLSWARLVQSIMCHDIFRSVLMLSSHSRLGLASDLFLQVSPPKPVFIFLVPHMCGFPTHRFIYIIRVLWKCVFSALMAVWSSVLGRIHRIHSGNEISLT